MEHQCRQLPHHALSVWIGLGVMILSGCQPDSPEDISKTGITPHTIRLGSVLALNGQEEALGNKMRVGLEAALKGKTVHGRRIELVFENDYYDPPVAEQKTRDLLDHENGIFLMIGNVGTPTAEKTLPILSQNDVPAVGFFTGASVLRSPSTYSLPSTRPTQSHSIVNYRASYAQEIAEVVDRALVAGVQVAEICAYVQNDGYGMAGLKGLREALAKANAPEDKLQAYDRVLDAYAKEDQKSTLNGIGPVGVYPRNTPYVNPGYNSLKQWERGTGVPCKLVVTAGTYSNVARFVKVARAKQESWVISALSFTGAEEFQLDLEEYGVPEKVIMTQVVPFLDSGLEIVDEAKSAIEQSQKNLDGNIQESFGYVSLEGYIVGKMVLDILNAVPGELNRDTFLEQAAISKFDLGGIDIDLTQGRTQASDLVGISVLTHKGFTKDPDALAEMFEAQ